MPEHDFEEDVFRFPLPIHLHGEDLPAMVQAVTFTGGMFYTVKGEGLDTLHILCTYDHELEGGQPHFIVMNKGYSDYAAVTAVLRALREPPEEDDWPKVFF